MKFQKVLRFSFVCSLSALMAVLLLSCGCVEDNKLHVESRSIQPVGVKSADIGLDMTNGEMKVRGNTDNLLDAEFIYNIEGLKPQVEYEIQDSTGKLTIR